MGSASSAVNGRPLASKRETLRGEAASLGEPLPVAFAVEAKSLDIASLSGPAVRAAWSPPSCSSTAWGIVTVAVGPATSTAPLLEGLKTVTVSWLPSEVAAVEEDSSLPF